MARTRKQIRRAIVVAASATLTFALASAAEPQLKERNDVEPRFILLDLKMPRVDGIEVLEAIKADERTKRTPVVIMTSSQEESDIVKSYDLGANSYVVKRIDFNSLADVARQAGFHWLAVNRAAPR